MSTFPTELAAEPDTQNIRSPKNYQRVPFPKNKKIDIVCKAISEGNAKCYLIMSIKSTFPTEVAAEPDTQNIRRPKNYQKGPCSRDKKIPVSCKTCWEGNAKWH